MMNPDTVSLRQMVLDCQSRVCSQGCFPFLRVFCLPNSNLRSIGSGQTPGWLHQPSSSLSASSSFLHHRRRRRRPPSLSRLWLFPWFLSFSPSFRQAACWHPSRVAGCHHSNIIAPSTPSSSLSLIGPSFLNLAPTLSLGPLRSASLLSKGLPAASPIFPSPSSSSSSPSSSSLSSLYFW